MRTVALLHSSDVIEDYLDSVALSLADFRDEMTGGWTFGYVEALRLAEVRVVLFLVSRAVSRATWTTHVPTGAAMCLLPPPPAYRALRGRLLGWQAKQLVRGGDDTVAPDASKGSGVGARSERALFGAARRLLSHVHVAPYLATPLLALARELRREGCEAVVCQEYENGRFDACVLLGRLIGLPVYATFQGESDQRSRIERWIRPLSIRSSAGLIVAPSREADRVSARYGLSRSRIARVFNPIDLGLWQEVSESDRARSRAELGIPVDAPTVIWHGRVEIDRKGLDVLLEAWHRLTEEQEGRDLRLIMVGTGTDAGELRCRLGASRGVLWLDRFVLERAEVRRLLSAADAYAFPSRFEGFPVAPIEAMACGLPVVAADAAGMRDILGPEDRAGGFVIPVGDARALGDRLTWLLEDPGRAREIGARARRRVEDAFSLPAVGQALGEFLFGEQAGRRPQPRAAAVFRSSRPRRSRSGSSTRTRRR